MKRVLVSWSTGKDSAWMLHELLGQADIEVVGLLTTFNESADRVAMHAVRRELAESQAKATGLPLRPVMLPWPCSNERYEQLMSEVIARARQERITHVAFGDLFLEDIRRYRVRQLAGSGVEPLFPVWCGPEGTGALSRTMVETGFRAIVSCVDPRQLDQSFAGRTYDAAFLDELPESVDPCGERGEFHTFCYAGPCFKAPLQVRAGEIVEREGFVFADVLPTEETVRR